MSSYDVVPYLQPLAQYFLYFSVQLFKVHVCSQFAKSGQFRNTNRQKQQQTPK